MMKYDLNDDLNDETSDLMMKLDHNLHPPAFEGF